MKIFTAKLTIVGISVVLCMVIAAIIRFNWKEKTVRASVMPVDIRLGESITLKDSTAGARVWLWELGNGDTLNARSATYTFAEAGKYQVRLLVNKSISTKFIVNVHPSHTDENEERPVKITAPDIAIQGEFIIFKGEGESKEWRWEFGESGMIDSRDKNTVYAYMQPGTYEVLLSTEDTKYPIRHTLEVLPRYADNDTIDVLGAIGEDIKIKLQAIADGEPFNENYHYVLDNYLCSNPDAMVIVNGRLRNDFYSYCQGLKITGLHKTIIEHVSVAINPKEEQCINKLNITQYESEE